MARVRALDANGDMQWGHGSRDYLVDTPSVVSQRAMTRLKLFTGDWFLNTLDGTPWRTAVLGRDTNASRDPALRARILGTPGCTGITSYASQQNRSTRGFSVQATISTQFGATTVSLVPAQNGDVRLVR